MPPPPPSVLLPASAPTFDDQAVRDMLGLAKSGSFMQQIDALQRLSRLLEDEEAKFREVAGDPWAIPNQRAGFIIGRILGIIKVRRQWGGHQGAPCGADDARYALPGDEPFSF